MTDYFIFQAFIGLIQSCIWGFITRAINRKKGRDGGFGWGFFLGAIGMIVVICRSSVDNSPMPADDSGSYGSNPTHLLNPIPDGGWRCTCGRPHGAQDLICVCGGTKRAALAAASVPSDVKPHNPQNWVCTCGLEHPPYESSCSCGKSKRQVLLEKAQQTAES